MMWLPAVLVVIYEVSEPDFAWNNHGLLEIVDIFVRYAFTIVFTFVMTIMMKATLRRVRPVFENWDWLQNLRGFEKNFALPSGDTAQASTFAFFIMFNYGNPFFLYIIPTVAYGRIYYQCHWIGDTIAGAFLGLLGAFISHMIVPNLSKLFSP